MSFYRADDFVKVARILKDAIDNGQFIGHAVTVFADAFQRDNPRFDRGMFERDCYGTPHAQVDAPEAYSDEGNI